MFTVTGSIQNARPTVIYFLALCNTQMVSAMDIVTLAEADVANTPPSLIDSFAICQNLQVDPSVFYGAGQYIIFRGAHSDCLRTSHLLWPAGPHLRRGAGISYPLQGLHHAPI